MHVTLANNRQDLEARCDELLEERKQSFNEWAKAKLAYDDLRYRTDDVLKAIMDKLDNGEMAENKLTRLAKREPEWRDHKDAVRQAYEAKLKAEIKRDQVRKEYELNVAKYMKS